MGIDVELAGRDPGASGSGVDQRDDLIARGIAARHGGAGLTGRVRVSAPYYNTEDEIAGFVGALTRISSA